MTPFNFIQGYYGQIKQFLTKYIDAFTVSTAYLCFLLFL